MRWDDAICTAAFVVFDVLVSVLLGHVLVSERLLIVQTFSRAAEAAPLQVELGRGYFSIYKLSMLVCARIFDLSYSRLSSLDHLVLQMQQLLASYLEWTHSLPMLQLLMTRLLQILHL